MTTSNTSSQPPAPSSATLRDKLQPVQETVQTSMSMMLNAVTGSGSGQPTPQPPAGPPQIQYQLNEEVTAQLAKILDLLDWQVGPRTTAGALSYVFTVVTKGNDCRCVIDLTDVMAKLDQDPNWQGPFATVGMLKVYLDSDPYLRLQNTNARRPYIVSEPSAQAPSVEIMRLFNPAKSLSRQDFQRLNGMSTEQQKRCVSCYLDLDKAGPCGPNRAWLDRLKATSVRIKAETMSEVDPDLTVLLENVLRRLPINDTYRGRSFLTDGLPGADANRSDDKDIDIRTIVNNARKLGLLQDGSTLALTVITKNAIRQARGSGLEQELEKVKLGLEEWHNQLEVVWQCVDQAIDKRSQEAGCAAD
jgi:hypothetical protein